MSHAESIQPVRRPTLLHVAVDDAPGAHRTDSLEAIWWWTPTLGPTATLAAVHLAGHAIHNPATAVDVNELRTMLGLGRASDRFWRTMDRLETFHVITWHSTNVVSVRVQLPALSSKQLDKLPERAALAYRLSTAA